MTIENIIFKMFFVLIAVRGGRGTFSIKCLNWILSQLRVMGGGVKLIETLFFFCAASLSHSYEFEIKNKINYEHRRETIIYRH